MIITKEIIEKIMPGKWYIEPEKEWSAYHISENKLNCKKGATLFIAMDKETWLKGTSNSGVYANWEDTHKLVHGFSDNIQGIVAQYPIKNLPRKIPQYIVDNSYNFISQCAEYVRDKIQSKVISITGTVGKTSTKDYLKLLLKEFGTSYATHGNHNSRTGVKLTLSNAISNPDYLVLETAMTALTMKTGGISQISRPDIAIITQIGVGQKGYDEDQTADFKSRIADGLKKDGVVIINRDIRIYDQLCDYVKRYHNNILSYGKHPSADVCFQRNEKGFSVTTKKYKYEINLGKFFDDGTLSNMVAAIATLSYLDLDIAKVQHLFNTFSNKSSTLEVDYLEEKQIHVIDDTYNAEYLSMVNAFKYCNERFKQNRKVLIIGDIINLEKKSKQVHEELLQPILENEFSLIATFGKDTNYLNHLLPKERNLGHYTDEKNCIERVGNHLKPEDVILIKGSRRNSTIHLMPKLLKEKLLSASKYRPGHQYVVTSLNNADFSENIWSTTTEYGIAPLLLTYLALRKYALDEIQLDTLYKVTLNVSKEGQHSNSLGLLEGEQYSFMQLMQYTILTQKPDCILALAEQLYQTTSQALSSIKSEAENLGIDPEKILNVTGRNYKDQIQNKTFRDIFSIARNIFNLPIYFREPFLVALAYFKGKVLEPISPVAYTGLLNGFLFIGDQYRRTYIAYREKEQPQISIFSITSNEQRIEYLLPYYQVFTDLPKSKRLTAKTPIINILGDTYFGEAYTEVREKRGVKDGLQQYGYGHSFKKIANFFNPDDINIVNFEAVFYDGKQVSPLDQIKPFILGANAKKTIEEFKSKNINCVVLANNHLKDYGSDYLISTLEHFNRADIKYIGAGRDQEEAHHFFEVTWQDKTYAIFNGYWHRDTAYKKFDFYALGHRAGVACSHGLLLGQILQYKRLHPQNKIIVINHWGIDFKPIHSEQEKLAYTLTQLGVDLIIGHGPHTIQPIKYINGKPVIFSIGNGIFNSNGEYDKHQAMPYGCIVRLNIDEIKLRIYPIYTNNLKTFWQPYLVGEEQFKQVKEYLTDSVDKQFIFGNDNLGKFIEILF